MDKNFNLSHNFQTIFKRYSFSHGTIMFDLVTLTLKFDLFLKTVFSSWLLFSSLMILRLAVKMEYETSFDDYHKF